MKRTLSILLTLALLLTLVACGNTPTAETESNEAAADPETTTSVTKETEAEPEKTDPAPANKLPAFNQKATIDETVMVDENNVRITATGLTYNNYAVELELTIENNSDKDLSFTSGSMGYSCNSVNGMMVADGYLNCDVAAGKKAMDTISFSYDSLQLYGIQEIADMEIGFYTTDDDYKSTYFSPRQVTTSAHGSYDYEKLYYQETVSSAAAQATFDYSVSHFAVDKLYDQDGIAVISQTLIQNADGEQMLLVELENNSQDIRNISVSDIMVNNLLVCDSRWCSDTVAPGKRAVIDINLSSVVEAQYWEIYGLQKIGSIGFSLQQSDADWNDLTEYESMVVEISGEGSMDSSGEELYNQNGVRIVAKTVLAPEEYGSYYHVLLLAENTGSNAVEVEIPWKTLSINGFMVDYYGQTWELQPGQCAMMEIDLYNDDLEDIKITEVSQITQVEFKLEIKEGRNLLEEPTITMNCQ